MNAIKVQFDEMREQFKTIDKRFDTVDTRFDAVDRRFDAIDTRLDAVDTRFDAVDRRFDAVDTRFDAVDTRFDTVDTRFDAVDRRFDAVDTRLTRVDTRLVRVDRCLTNVEGEVTGHGRILDRLDTRVHQLGLLQEERHAELKLATEQFLMMQRATNAKLDLQRESFERRVDPLELASRHHASELERHDRRLTTLENTPSDDASENAAT